MDISFTRDGYPIVMHGPDIGRTVCTKSLALGKKNIADFDLQEMKD
jgi:glycerophosphoryl diester phosphodiesterase